MITIKINGKEKEIAEDMTIAEYIDSEGLLSTNVAIARNGKLVPKQDRATVRFAQGDNIIIIQASYGG